jgi:AcrR family transcriptional regulator
MERKPKRRTRERILETSLKLFNDFGEPNVTTTVIADEMDISPGNLYYHFRSKDEIVNTIFGTFEREIEGVLAAPAARQANVEDMWLFLHVLFEAIWKYRFLYRDLNDLLSRNRLLEIHFKRARAKYAPRPRCAKGSPRAASCARSTARSPRSRPTWSWSRPTGCPSSTCATRAICRRAR